MIWAWMETSRAEIGSSQTMSARVAGQSAGDADALALPPGELVRHAVGHRLGRGPRSGRAPPRSLAARAPALDHDGGCWQRLAHDVARRFAGGPASRIGVLKDHGHARAAGADLSLAQLRDVLPREGDAPGGRLVETEHAAADGGLAAAALPTSPRVSPLRSLKLTPSTALTSATLWPEAPGDREVHLEVLDLEERAVPPVGAVVGTRCRCHGPYPSSTFGVAGGPVARRRPSDRSGQGSR